VVDALLRHNDDAITEANRAVELLPIKEDALEGPTVALNRAVVYAWTGKVDQAFSELENLSKVPYGLFYNHAKLAPYFDPLRKDPRFAKLVDALAPHS
jgi:hypothetical protein